VIVHDIAASERLVTVHDVWEFHDTVADAIPGTCG
jgi:hypothetical protein